MVAASGMALVMMLIAVVAGVFVSVLSFVALLKVLQIAEDLRYIRSKSDIHIDRPKPYKNTVVTCVVVSVIIVFVILGMMFMTGTMGMSLAGKM